MRRVAVLCRCCRRRVRSAMLRIERRARRAGQGRASFSSTGGRTMRLPVARRVEPRRGPGGTAALRGRTDDGAGCRLLVEPLPEIVPMPRKTNRAVIAGLAGRPASAGRAAGTTTRRRNGWPEARRVPAEPGAAGVDGQGVRRIADAFDLLRQAQSPGSGRYRGQRDALACRRPPARPLAPRHGSMACRPLDLARPSVDGGARGGSLAPGEAAQRHRDECRRAAAADRPAAVAFRDGARDRGASGREPAGPRAGHVSREDRRGLWRWSASARGLHRLCSLWGMKADAHPLPIEAWRDDTEDSQATGRVRPRQLDGRVRSHARGIALG